MFEIIVACLAQHGWHKGFCDVFLKTFETAVAPKEAQVWLAFDKECDRWWLHNGDFTSAGENVLATSHAIFPVGMPQAEIEKTVTEFVADMERRIAEAWSVRLLRHVDRSAQNSDASESRC